ncbi:hypothetical protein [Alcanivorax sp.]|uniref:hypothetical protein n=1 Tax=Alcanivorax sp. TaxID=1872427 RepID=UPI0025BD033A|nr:hypothetical protein [Alcanivorax sp.]
MNKRRIVIHAGFHKTGSTSLQLSAARGRQELIELGVLFPEAGYDEWESHKGMATSGHSGVVAAPTIFFAELDSECERIEREGRSIKTVLVSAENLLHPNSTLGLERLISFLEKNKARYDPVIVFTNREVEALYESHLKEVYSNQGAKILFDPYDFYQRKSASIEKLHALKEQGRIKIDMLPYGDIYQRIGSLMEDASQVESVLGANHVNSYSSKGEESNRLDIFKRYWRVRRVSVEPRVLSCAYYSESGDLGYKDIKVERYSKGVRYRVRCLVLRLYLWGAGFLKK